MTFRIKSTRNARLILSTDIREHDVQYAGSNHTKEREHRARPSSRLRSVSGNELLLCFCSCDMFRKH
ncbi:hypothetical protein EYF80_049106 [Liparis tanakae]|uniref:Uncharacterized protein n=1 Tax=Liparis tanakae TaxID=230148 RepID=A0A4Z2FHM1_9TELE|nr:hypothetical protein EYF80_049106 [Liparis tanakae]